MTNTGLVAVGRIFKGGPSIIETPYAPFENEAKVLNEKAIISNISETLATNISDPQISDEPVTAPETFNIDVPHFMKTYLAEKRLSEQNKEVVTTSNVVQFPKQEQSTMSSDDSKYSFFLKLESKIKRFFEL